MFPPILIDIGTGNIYPFVDINIGQICYSDLKVSVCITINVTYSQDEWNYSFIKTNSLLDIKCKTRV